MTITTDFKLCSHLTKRSPNNRLQTYQTTISCQKTKQLKNIFASAEGWRLIPASSLLKVNTLLRHQKPFELTEEQPTFMHQNQ